MTFEIDALNEFGNFKKALNEISNPLKLISKIKITLFQGFLLFRPKTIPKK